MTNRALLRHSWLVTRRRALILGAGLTLAGLPDPPMQSARAATINVNEGNIAPLPIAVPDVLAGPPADGDLPRP